MKVPAGQQKGRTGEHERANVVAQKGEHDSPENEGKLIEKKLGAHDCKYEGRNRGVHLSCGRHRAIISRDQIRPALHSF